MEKRGNVEQDLKKDLRHLRFAQVKVSFGQGFSSSPFIAGNFVRLHLPGTTTNVPGRLSCLPVCLMAPGRDLGGSQQGLQRPTMVKSKGFRCPLDNPQIFQISVTCAATVCSTLLLLPLEPMLLCGLCMYFSVEKSQRIHSGSGLSSSKVLDFISRHESSTGASNVSQGKKSREQKEIIIENHFMAG